MQWRAGLILCLFLCIQNQVHGVSLFNFWSHILPGGAAKQSTNSVTSDNSGEEVTEPNYENATLTPTTVQPRLDIDNVSSEESKITQLLNPMSWFKKTPKKNAFQINAELGTVSGLHNPCMSQSKSTQSLMEQKQNI